MHPVLFEIDNVVVHTYGIMAAIGFLSAFILVKYLGIREGFEEELLSNLALLILVSAIIGARLFYVATEHEFYFKHPAEILKFWKGGLVFYGGFIAAFISAFIFLKRKSMSVTLTADVFAPAIALGHAFGRIGCFSAGCCYGKPSSGFFSVIFHDPYSLAPVNIPIYPTQLYSSFVNFVIFLILVYFLKKRKYPGEVFSLYLILYGTARFLIEFLRGDDRGGFFFYNTLSIAQIICIVSILAGFSLLYFIRSNRGYDRKQHA